MRYITSGLIALWVAGGTISCSTQEAQGNESSGQDSVSTITRVALPPPDLPRTHIPTPTVPNITEQDLMTRVYIFADDSMLGRAAGTIGHYRATEYLASEVERMGLQPGGDSGTYFQTYPMLGDDGTPVPYPTRNVIAILPGTHPELRHTYVVLGSHSDHIGVTGERADHDSLRIYNFKARPRGAGSTDVGLSADAWDRLNNKLSTFRKMHISKVDSVANGADDDASGSMAMLEIAEYLVALPKNDRPKRSILFIWHTAEEIGLKGSEYFTDNLGVTDRGGPVIERDSIMAMVNLDMIGRGFPHDQPAGGGDLLQLVGSRRLSTQLGDFVEQINRDRGYRLKLDYSYDTNNHPEQIYCRSDHANYARWGIPVVFLFTGDHADYHMLIDEAQYINYPHLKKVTRYVSDLMLTLSRLDSRLVVDRPVPDPSALCVQ